MRMDRRRTDGRTQWKIMLLSHYLTMRGSDVAGLDEFQPVVKEITWPTDGRMTDGRTDARKNNVALAPPLHEGKWCSKFVWISPTGLGGEHDGLTDRRWRSQYPHSLKKKKTRGPWWSYIAHLSKQLCKLTVEVSAKLTALRFLYKFYSPTPQRPCFFHASWWLELNLERKSQKEQCYQVIMKLVQWFLTKRFLMCFI